MITKIKNLTAIIDNELQYVKEAYDNESNFDEKVFSDYIEKMKESLNTRYNRLVKESTNDKLIATYKTKIEKAFK